MKTATLFIAVVLISLSGFISLPSSASSQMETHEEWIAKSLREIEAVKVGMTRADLAKVFSTEGGLSTRTQQRFVYRECPYIKVDVEFEAVGQPGNRTIRNPDDKITKISKPFLEWTIID